MRGSSTSASRARAAIVSARLWDSVQRDEPVEVSIGFLNDSGGLVASATLWWTGRVISGMLEADGIDQGRAPEQRITVESLFGELDRSGDFEFSPESQARRGHDTDEFFEFARSMVDAKIGWSETVRLNVRPASDVGHEANPAMTTQDQQKSGRASARQCGGRFFFSASSA